MTHFNWKHLFATLLLVIFCINTNCIAQGTSDVRFYLVGNDEFPGTNYWKFTHNSGLSSEIQVSVIKRDDRFVILTLSSQPLGPLRIVLRDNTLINCIRRPAYDHYINNRLHSIYYLTDSEANALSRSDIENIMVTERPLGAGGSLMFGRNENTPRYYTYRNRYTPPDNYRRQVWDRTWETNTTAREIRSLVRFTGRNSHSGSTGWNKAPDCHCETVVVQGNRSYMCAPEQIHVSSRVNLAIMMVESGDQKYVVLNALTTGPTKKFGGPLTIDFDNGRSHILTMENTHISKIGGEDVAQGVFRVLFTTQRSISDSNMSSVSFRFDNEPMRTYRLTENSHALRQQIQCF